jgi:hypothetical protein
MKMMKTFSRKDLVDSKTKGIFGITSASMHSIDVQAKPTFLESLGLWVYGNPRLLTSKRTHVNKVCTGNENNPQDLIDIAIETNRLVFDGFVIVSGIHNRLHRQSALVPLRWGSPRILVISGGFTHYFGDDFGEEPFPLARRWRDRWDPRVDLAVSAQAPDARPCLARHIPAVNRLVQKLAG